MTDGDSVAPGERGGASDEELRIDTSMPHSARVYNYCLGGKDNYAVDRAAAEAYRQVYPAVFDMALGTRLYLTRAVRFLAGEAGIRQFLDIGTGLPTVDNTHEVAQRVAPEARIVYVDNDPLVLMHARALLTSTPEGATHYIDADIREPQVILDLARPKLDFDRPVGLMLMGILGHVTDDELAESIIRQLLEPLPSGSYLAFYDSTGEFSPEFREAQRIYDASGALPYRLRSAEQMTRFFEGLEMVEPGLVTCESWRPEATPFGDPPRVDAFCAVARKP